MTRNGNKGDERSLLLLLRRVGGGESSSSSSSSASPSLSRSYGTHSVAMPSLKSLMASRRAAMGPVPSSTSASTSQAAAATAPLLQRPSCNEGSPLAGSSNNGAVAGVFLKRRRDSLEGSTGSDVDTPLPLLRNKGPSCTSLPRVPAISVSSADSNELRKCETVVTLSNLMLNQQPLRPVNRLRVPPPHDLPPSRVCSRCSSLLSMAGSSSRYSLNAASGTFVPSASTAALAASASSNPPLLLCKLCLSEVPMPETVEILRCSCCFCKECMKAYVEFEINEGAYDISCPDAQCENEGVITLQEVARLISPEMMDKYHRFRLNREVDLDASRTWCPRAGCETVCTVCSTGGCVPQAVHCPTCSSDFCSNCRGSWHAGLSCEDHNRRPNGTDRGGPSSPPGIPFDSDLIKCCPMCNVPIEKDEGCAQMMCKRCKHVFCWYCLASLDDDFLLRHYDKGPCKNKLGHSRASVIWHRTQVIGIFAGFGILLLVASPLLLLAAPCIVCCKCRVCSGGTKLDGDDDLPDVP